MHLHSLGHRWCSLPKWYSSFEPLLVSAGTNDEPTVKVELLLPTMSYSSHDISKKYLDLCAFVGFGFPSLGPIVMLLRVKLMLPYVIK